MRKAILAVFSAAGLALSASGAAACGLDSDCVVNVEGQGERSYRIYLPEGVEEPMGAIVYAHGYRGSSSGAMRNGGFMAMADRLGVAFIAVNADDNPDWILPGTPSDPGYRGRRELDYMRAVLDDAEARFGLDRDRMLMTGFSAGGMLTWNLICDEGALFAAYAPVSGTFWDPIPENCSAPVADVIHVHGTADRVVPIGGRPIRATSQGDVREAFALYAAHGGFGAPEAADWEGLDCARRTNADGRVLELCLHDGGHDFRTAYIERAWRRFEALGVL